MFCLYGTLFLILIGGFSGEWTNGWLPSVSVVVISMSIQITRVSMQPNTGGISEEETRINIYICI